MSSPTTWMAVDEYLIDLFAPQDAVLDAVLQESDAAGLPPHHVSPNQGKLLYLLAKIQRAERILEIGTLGGYSTIWLARALGEKGSLITLEADPKHAEVARANIRRASLEVTVDLRLGPALETLPRLLAEGAGPFDLIFIDADKPNNPAYLTWAKKLARLGSLIVVDNVVRDGAVIDERSTDPNILGVRRFFDLLAADSHLSATALQTVGCKGYDGFALAIVLAEG